MLNEITDRHYTAYWDLLMTLYRILTGVADVLDSAAWAVGIVPVSVLGFLAVTRHLDRYGCRHRIKSCSGVLEVGSCVLLRHL